MDLLKKQICLPASAPRVTIEGNGSNIGFCLARVTSPVSRARRLSIQKWMTISPRAGHSAKRYNLVASVSCKWRVATNQKTSEGNLRCVNKSIVCLLKAYMMCLYTVHNFPVFLSCITAPFGNISGHYQDRILT